MAIVLVAVAASAAVQAAGSPALAGPPPPCNPIVDKVEWSYYGTPEWGKNGVVTNAFTNGLTWPVSRDMEITKEVRFATTVSYEVRLGSTVEAGISGNAVFVEANASIALEVEHTLGFAAERTTSTTFHATTHVPNIPPGATVYYKGGMAIQTLQRKWTVTEDDCSVSTQIKYVNVGALTEYVAEANGTRTDVAKSRRAMGFDDLFLPQIDPPKAGGTGGGGGNGCLLQSCTSIDTVYGGSGGSGGGSGSTGGSGPRRADLVVHGESAPYNWAVATSSGTAFNDWSGIGLSGWSMGDWSGLADVTGDRVADLVTHNPQFQRFDVAVGDGRGGFGAPQTGTWLSQWAAGDWAGLGDVNGDGKADLVVHGESGPYNWAVAMSNGTSFGGWSGIALSGWSMGDFAALGDVNGDGKADLVVHGESAPYNWAVAMSNGQTFSGWSGIGLSGWSQGDFAGLADVNGDGRADIVVHNPQFMRFDVALSTGNTFTSGGTWLSQWAAGDWTGLGDVNGDGRADIVVHNPQFMRFDVALSTGGAFTSAGTWLSQWAKGQFVALANVNGS